MVFEQTGPAHGDTVSFPADGLDAIITVRLSVRPLQELRDGGGRSFPPLGDLLLDQHNEPEYDLYSARRRGCRWAAEA